MNSVEILSNCYSAKTKTSTTERRSVGESSGSTITMPVPSLASIELSSQTTPHCLTVHQPAVLLPTPTTTPTPPPLLNTFPNTQIPQTPRFNSSSSSGDVVNSTTKTGTNNVMESSVSLSPPTCNDSIIPINQQTDTNIIDMITSPIVVSRPPAISTSTSTSTRPVEIRPTFAPTKTFSISVLHSLNQTESIPEAAATPGSDKESNDEKEIASSPLPILSPTIHLMSEPLPMIDEETTRNEEVVGEKETELRFTSDELKWCGTRRKRSNSEIALGGSIKTSREFRRWFMEKMKRKEWVNNDKEKPFACNYIVKLLPGADAWQEQKRIIDILNLHQRLNGNTFIIDVF